MKVFIWILAFFLLLDLGLGVFWVYWWGGLKYYIEAAISVNKLTGSEKGKALADFYGTGDPGKYGGILGYINKNGYGGVWVWGNRGPRYFRADQYSVFSSFDICKDQILAAIAKGEGKSVSIDRSIDTDIKIWAKKAKTGDFAVVLITPQGQAGTPGNLREIKSQNWWAFMPVDIKKQCGK